MLDIPPLLIATVVLALFFDYTNGFHDTANAIASVIATRVLHPSIAILLAAIANFIGALLTTYVAQTIAGDLVDSTQITMLVILAAVVAAIIWNLITWRLGVPSSSSHALMGGLIGAALVHGGTHTIFTHAIWFKIILPMIFVPALGFIVGMLFMAIVCFLFSNHKAKTLKPLFNHLQILASGFKALSHGQNDAQKTMGIITLSLVASGYHQGTGVPLWVKLSCAGAIGIGTAVGGWRIIRTMAKKIVQMESVHGFAADSSAAGVIFVASLFGMPISTSHVVAASIFGVGTARRPSSVRWRVGQSIVLAWILTLPCSAIVSALIYKFLQFFQMSS